MLTVTCSALQRFTNAVVCASDSYDQWCATTDTSGYYTIHLPVGTYDACAAALNYVTSCVNRISILEGTRTQQDFALDGSRLYYAPTAIHEVVSATEVVTNTVTVTNTGPRDVAYNVNPQSFAGPLTLPAATMAPERRPKLSAM